MSNPMSGTQDYNAPFPTLTAHTALIEGIGKQLPLRELSILYIKYILALNNGNKCHAAIKLQIDRRTIQRMAVHK